MDGLLHGDVIIDDKDVLRSSSNRRGCGSTGEARAPPPPAPASWSAPQLLPARLLSRARTVISLTSISTSAGDTGESWSAWDADADHCRRLTALDGFHCLSATLRGLCNC